MSIPAVALSEKSSPPPGSTANEVANVGFDSPDVVTLAPTVALVSFIEYTNFWVVEFAKMTPAAPSTATPSRPCPTNVVDTMPEDERATISPLVGPALATT
jgi:hypothetical protein